MNRINPAAAIPLGGFKVESTPEMQTVEALQAQLEELQKKGDEIIREATDEIMKRNACLQEALRIIERCRQVLIKGTDVETLTVLFEDIEKFAGPTQEKNENS